MGGRSRGDFSWEVGGTLSQKKFLSRTYEKLRIKENHISPAVSQLLLYKLTYRLIKTPLHRVYLQYFIRSRVITEIQTDECMGIP